MPGLIYPENVYLCVHFFLREDKMNIEKRRFIGYIAGIVAGISYGTNPLFAKPLMGSGVPVMVMLFFRYGLSACILALWMLLRNESFRAGRREISLLLILGVLFSCSSLFLFSSYAFIPSGLATTLVYLYPVFVALIMVLLRFYPSWQTWLSIIATFGGIVLLSQPSHGAEIRLPGIILAILSALSYAFYLVIVNRSKRIKHVSEHTLTLYAQGTYTGTYHVAFSFEHSNGKRYFLTQPIGDIRYARARPVGDWTDTYQGMSDPYNTEPNYISTYKLIGHPTCALCEHEASYECVLDPRREWRYGAKDSLLFYSNFAPANDVYLGFTVTLHDNPFACIMVVPTC